MNIIQYNIVEINSVQTKYNAKQKYFNINFMYYYC